MPQVGESPRQQALKRLNQQFPAANQQVAQGQQAARQIQLQQQVGQAPIGLSSRTAQQVGTQQAQQAASIQTEAAKREQAEQIQLGQLGLQERGRQLRGIQANAERAFVQQKADAEKRLSGIKEDITQKLFDQNMQFRQDERGRTKFNADQLQDWVILKAQKGEDIANYKQTAMQQLEKKRAMVKIAYQRAEQHLDQLYAQAEQEKNQESMKKIADLKQQAKQLQIETEAKIREQAATWKGVTSIIKSGAKYGAD